MSLAMSRPWKHPKTGIYHLRKAVPEDLLKLVGKREEKLTLKTRDPVEAKQRFAKALAELEAPGPTCAPDRDLLLSLRRTNSPSSRTING
jgi:hypothetical protein